MINNTYLGSNKPTAYYFGSTEATRIYKGSDLIYQKADNFVFETDVTYYTFPAKVIDLQTALIISTKNGIDQPYDLGMIQYSWVQVEMLQSPPDEIDGGISTTAEIMCSENTSTTSSRSSTVSFMQRESGNIVTIVVTQSPAEVTTSISPESINYLNGGGKKYISYYPSNTTNVTVTANAAWLSYQINQGEIVFTATANLSTSSRISRPYITINGQRHLLYVTQDAYNVGP